MAKEQKRKAADERAGAKKKRNVTASTEEQQAESTVSDFEDESPATVEKAKTKTPSKKIKMPSGVKKPSASASHIGTPTTAVAKPTRQQKVKWTPENDVKLLKLAVGKVTKPFMHQAIADDFPEKPTAKSVGERLTKLRKIQKEMMQDLGYWGPFSDDEQRKENGDAKDDGKEREEEEGRTDDEEKQMHEDADQDGKEAAEERGLDAGLTDSDSDEIEETEEAMGRKRVFDDYKIMKQNGELDEDSDESD